MSSIGTGVEYAGKAVENSGTAVGVCCKDGVVVGVEKMVPSKMLVKGSGRRIFAVDRHCGIAFSGMTSDARMLAKRARSEAQAYNDFYGFPIPGKALSTRMGSYMHVYTLYWHVRPFGASILLASNDRQHGPTLWMVDPSGLNNGFNACAVGKGKQVARTELEKIDFSTITCREAAKQIAKIIHQVHDKIKDKDFELEMSWVCEESKNQFVPVPKDVLEEAEKWAEEQLESDDEDSDDDSDDE